MEKISAWNLTKVRSKKELIDEARTKGAKVHFASLMDICHLKNAELKAKHQKYKGRDVLRGDIAKGDSAKYPVLRRMISITNDSCTSNGRYIRSTRMRRTSSRRNICSYPGQLLKIPKSECPDIWIRLPKHRWPKSWSSMEDPVVPLERNLYGHPVAGPLWERQFEIYFFYTRMGKSSKLGILFVN